MNPEPEKVDLAALGARLKEIRGDAGAPPSASIIIPVNACADLERVLPVLDDIGGYSGPHTFELLLVINNYDPASPPAAIERFRQMGARVVAVPSARRPGEVVILSARALGIAAAQAEITMHFDADSRLLNSTALLDWYVSALQAGARLAYTHVDYYDVPRKPAVHVKLWLHHAVRRCKRLVFGIPTTRGSNYAVARAAFLACYEAGELSVDMQLGPAVKLAGGRIAYSGKRALRVLTSGRRFSGSWRRLLPYLLYRLRYNLHAIPTRRRPVTRESWAGFDVESERRLTAAGSTSAIDLNDPQLEQDR